jgi:PAS domain S-box-containing protein
MTAYDASLRSALAHVALGESLDAGLREVCEAASRRLRLRVCRAWLVKAGDVCERCVNGASCDDRALCLHLRIAVGEGGEPAARVPLEVLRDRVASRGGTGKFIERSRATNLLFAGLDHLEGASYALLPLRGPAGILGLMGVVREQTLSGAEFLELQGYASAAILAIRLADLSSRSQRAAQEVESAKEYAAEVGGLLHSILAGATEYAVVAEDLDGKVTVFNEGAKLLYGYAPEDVINRVKSDVLYAPEEIASGKLVDVLSEASSTGRSEAVVMRLRKNGERFPTQATFTARRDREGDVCGFVVVERDISHERNSARLSATAVRQMAQMEDYLASLKAANAMLEDEVARLRSENELLGGELAIAELQRAEQEAEHLVRRRDAELAVAEAEAASASASVEAAKYEQELRESERRREFLVGRVDELQARVRELTTENAVLRASRDELEARGRELTEWAQDIEGRSAERERRLRQLEQGAVAARQADEVFARLARAKDAQSRYLVDLSHELRSPINAIVGFASLMIEGGESLEPSQRAALATIRRHARDLLRLVNNVLDLAKLDAGRMDLVTEPIDLGELIADVRETVATEAAERGLELVVDVAEDARRVDSDRVKVQQILVNLLANAVKFTPLGKVSVATRRDGDEVVLEVLDTGIGIAEKDLERIFDEYVQVGNAGGTGLGLPIARRLATHIGGTLEADSRVGWGSRFALRLPAHSAKSTDQELEASLAGGALLLCTADANEAYLAARYLREVGRFTATVPDADRAARLAASAGVPLVVLGLDREEDWHVLSQLRQGPSPTRVVALVSGRDANRALSSGACGVVSRPVERQRLVRAVEQALSGEMRRILVADDEADARELVVRLLGPASLDIVTAADGPSALLLAQRMRPDLILLDLMMPGMDGYEVIHHLNADPELAKTPIIVITARDLSGDERRALGASVVRVVPKGDLDRDRLMAAIAHAVGAR